MISRNSNLYSKSLQRLCRNVTLSTSNSIRLISSTSIKSASPIGTENISSNGPGIELNTRTVSANFSFPTPNDLSAKQQFLGSVIKVWSLLDAALANQQYKRGVELLETLYAITDFNNEIDAGTFIDAFNKYLFAWTRSNDVSMNEIEVFLKDMKKQFPNLYLDGRSVAILTRASIEKEEGPSYKRFINKWLNEGKPINEVLNNVDVLMVTNLKKLNDEMDKISIKDIPKQYRGLVEEASRVNKIDSESVVKELEKDENRDDSWTRNSEALKKEGYEELKATGTFGLKVIRHSLSALSLKSNEEFVKTFLSNLENPEQYIDRQEDSVNFFKLYNSLTTQEERRLFHELLNEFNEERQRQLEARSIEGAEKSWQINAEEVKKRGGLKFKDNEMHVLCWKWYKDLLPLIQEDVKLCQKFIDSQKDNGDEFNFKFTINGKLRKFPPAALKLFSPAERARLNDLADIAPLLTLLSPEKMTVVTILEILRQSSSSGVIDGVKSARAVTGVGKAVEFEYKSEVLLNKEADAFKGLSEGAKTTRLRKILMQSRASFRKENLTEEELDWPITIRAKLGAILISALIKVARINVFAVDPRTGKEVNAEMPAIVHTYQYSKGTKLGVLKLHKTLLHRLGTESLKFSIYPQSLPMLNEPKDWSSWNIGGYEFSRNNVIRTKNSREQIAYIKAASSRGGIDRIYEGLNALGKTPWTVNERVLKVLTKVWNSEEEFLAIPKVMEEPEFPAAPARDSDPSIKSQWRNHCRSIAVEYSTARSTRCDTNYKVEIARAFVGERFYYPHNLDFRGRAYPLSPHFNHLGNDLSRGLLIFWEGKKLGPRGLFWLKVHLGNLFGLSKKSFDERVEFVDENMEKIRKSAENPLGGREYGFWTEAEDPWQALAVMFEVNEAIKSGNPEEFISHQPVHQDGTCNGLQHYAALGGDIEGARQVNLEPSQRPQDVYTHVCEITRGLLQKEVEKNGSEKAKKILTVLGRKIVKQTVMTNVYGVTFVGANAQIRKQLKDYFDSDEAYVLAHYLTNFVFEAIRTLFSGAHLIQTWLGVCAKRVTKSINVVDILDTDFNDGKVNLHMSSVIWTSPLGLPVVQPYRQNSKRQIATNLQTMYLQDPFELNQVYSQRQVNAFAPNYIHSLDATHMLLSAIECHKAGIAYASVHDSYWTHASTVDNMNSILRKAFVELHEADLIENLKQEMETRYRDHLLVIKIPSNIPVAEKILKFRQDQKEKSDKKRIAHVASELALERQRLKLLRSGNPDSVKAANEMVTSVSILTEEEIHEMYETWAELQEKVASKQKRTIESRAATVESLEAADSDSKAKTLADIYKEDSSPRKSSSDFIKVIVPYRCPETPKRGSFKVSQVLKSPYFFS